MNLQSSRVALFSILACWSSALSYPFSADAELSQEQWIMDDLKANLPADQQLELKAGEQAFMAWQQESMAAFTKGSVIFLTDGAQHTVSRQTFGALRSDLVNFGWNTLSLVVPPYYDLNQAEDRQAYQQQLQQRVAAALTHAKQTPGAIVVVAQGSNGALINQLIEQKLIDAPQALVLLGASLLDPQANLASIKAMSKHQVPTLDIIQQSDNSSALASLQYRSQWTRKQVKDLYRQRYWPEDQSLNQQWLEKEMIGWLRYIGY